MKFIRIILMLTVLGALAACSNSKFKTYRGPEVTRIVVMKGERQMYLLHNDRLLKRYRIGLGFGPVGPKQIEGDGRTPVGRYVIDRRNPESRYHLSLGVSYPNAYDVAFAESLGKSPGGDIFIHGQGKFYRKGSPQDWTWGCIALSDKEIEEVYSMIQQGTVIDIYE